MTKLINGDYQKWDCPLCDGKESVFIIHTKGFIDSTKRKGSVKNFCKSGHYYINSECSKCNASIKELKEEFIKQGMFTRFEIE